jgi:hypothetical protein
MRGGPTFARSAFCLAAATTAAALADPLVEALSNAGVFGPGHFTDRSNADVLPALFAGVVFAILFVCGLARRALSASSPAPGWIRTSAGAVSPGSVARLLPATFALQIGALFGMETLEQIVIRGHALGGTVWLGGPIAFSLLVHAAAGVLVIALFARLLQWLAQTVVEVIRFVRRLILAWSALTPPALVAQEVAPRRRSDERAFDRLKGRAPPHLI